MLRQIILKELLISILDGKYFFYILFTTICLVGSFIILKSDYERKYGEHLKLSTEFEKDKSEREQLSWTDNMFSFAPKPLQVVCLGTEMEENKFSDVSLYASRRHKYPFLKREEFSNPLNRFFPSFDLPLIVIYILSLMVFIFSHDTVSRERELGTLKLLLSYSLSRGTVIMGKLFSGFIGVVLPLTFSYLLCILIVEFSPSFRFTQTDFISFTVIYILTALYLLGLYFLGIFISTRCRNSSTSIALLILFWLIFIIMIHNTSILIIEKNTKANSIAATLDKLEKNRDNFWDRIGDVVLKKYNIKSWDDVDRKSPQWSEMLNYYYDSVFEYLEGPILDAYSSYINIVEHEYSMLTGISYCSPSLVYLSSVVGMADTGVQGHLNLLREIVGYIKYYRQELQKSMHKNISTEKREKRIKNPYSALKKFQVPSTSIGNRLEAATWNIFSMVLFCAVFFMLAFFSFIRIDIS